MCSCKMLFELKSAETPRKVWRMSGNLVVAAGLGLVGKKTQTVTVSGILAGDALVVTPKASVPRRFPRQR
jgi:hypothetical protein